MAEQGDAVVSSSTSCLLSLQSTKSLLSPIEGTKKIKYTCIAASQNFVALGANTGGVYCFHRNDYKYIRILASKEGSISQVRFSPNENYLAVCSGGGYVGLWELNLHEQGVSKRLHVSSSLKDAAVKDMVWDNKGNRVFFGDDLGRVAITYLPKQKIFKKPDEIILQEKVPVIQLDFHQEQLLVSTLTRCLILKLLTKETVQVGTRARDGPFGTCFHSRWPDRPPVVFSARPGGRLWQADVEGTVVSTLKLKDAVSMSATPILGAGFDPVFTSSSSSVSLPHALNFQYLYLLHNIYMVGWVDKNLYLFEPAAYRLAAWTNDLGSILDLYCDGRQLFVLSEGVGSVCVSVISFVSLETCVQWLVNLKLFGQASQVLVAYNEELSLKMSNDEMLCNDVKTVLASLEEKEHVSPLKDLQKTLTELEEKFGRQGITSEKSEIVQLNGESNFEKVVVEQDELDGGFQTVDLTAFSDTQLDSDIETDHVTTNTDHLSSITNHVTPATYHVTSERDHSADFPTTHQPSTDDLSEPNLDSTLIPDGGQSDSDSLQLNSSSMTSLTLEDPITTDPSPDTNITIPSHDGDRPKEEGESKTGEDLSLKDPLAMSGPTSISPFPEEIGTELLANLTRSKSQAIPSRVLPALSHTLNSAGDTPESGTSVLSTSYGGHEIKNSYSEPQSFENRSSLECEFKLPKKQGPDFANRVAAALSSCSHDDDNVVVAVPVRSGSSKETSKTRTKKKSSRKKKSPSPVHSLGRRLSTPELIEPVSKTPSPSRSLSLVHIPEEALPFPEAGLPPTPPTHTSHPPSLHSSAPSSQNVSPFPSLPSSPPKYHPTDALTNNSNNVQNGFPDTGKSELTDTQALTEGIAEPSPFGGIQKPSGLLSKVKSIAKQGGVNLVESNKIQRQVKMVKGLLSSLANPPPHTPPSQLTESQQNVYHNDNYGFLSPILATPLSPPVEQGEMVGSPPTDNTDGDQSDQRISTMDSETTEFVVATMATAKSLEDPEVFCSTDSVLASLQDWLSNLSTFRDHLCSPQKQGDASDELSVPTNERTFLSSYYLDIDTAVRQTVTDLASLCFEMCCYGDLDNRGVVEFVQRYSPILDVQRLRNVLSGLNWEDRVRIWKHLVATYQEGTTSTANSEASLQRLCSKESPPSDAELCQLPALLLRFCRKSSSFIADCVKCFPSVSPWEVAVTCDQSRDQKQSCDNHTEEPDSLDQSQNSHTDQSDSTYVCYLNELLKSQKAELGDILCQDPKFLLRSLEASLVYHRRDATHGGDGHVDVTELLVECCVSIKSTDILTEARELCLSNRYWVGVVWLSVAMGDKRKALHTLLCLKDLSLFTNEQKWGNILNSLKDWRLLLQLMPSCEICPHHPNTTPQSSPSVATPTVNIPPSTKQQGDTDVSSTQDYPDHPVAVPLELCETSTQMSGKLEEHPSAGLVQDPSQKDLSEVTSSESGVQPHHEPLIELTWTGILRLMIGSLPPAVVVKLLSGCHGDCFDGVLGEQLHGLLSQLTQIQTKQRAIGHSLLEKVDRYLWSPRSSALGPQLLSVQNSEKQSSEQSQEHPHSLMLTSVSPLSGSLEDAAVHWGVRTRPDTTCPICRLSVLSPVSDLQPGVVVLRCGHSFHKSCLPESACLVCFATNVRKRTNNKN